MVPVCNYVPQHVLCDGVMIVIREKEKEGLESVRKHQPTSLGKIDGGSNSPLLILVSNKQILGRDKSWCRKNY